VQDLGASFVKSCGNGACSGFFGSDAEVENLRETCSVLRKFRVGVWIVFGRSVTDLRRGFSAGKLYIGSERAMSVGVVVWLGEDRHVVVPQGNCLERFLAQQRVDLPPATPPRPQTWPAHYLCTVFPPRIHVVDQSHFAQTRSTHLP
jgi:hypothetical protein